MSLTIAHIGDPQLGFNLKGEDPETKYREDLARMERVIETVNGLRPDVALISGDMTHRGADIVRDWPRLLPLFKVPVIATPGNHDVGQRLTREALDRYKSIFGRDYGTMDVNGWRIIFGNTQYWLETDETESQARYEEWLSAEIERAKDLRGKVILAGHNAPFAYIPDEPDAYENCPKASRFARLDAYLAAGARFYFAGHMHRLSVRGYRGLTILTAEGLSLNFDQRPFGFRVFQVADDFSYSWDFRAI
jgi:3',5'-cyclic AMP phosphodiesterase CpdA